MQTIKTYFKWAPFYNALLRTYLLRVVLTVTFLQLIWVSFQTP